MSVICLTWKRHIQVHKGISRQGCSRTGCQGTRAVNKGLMVWGMQVRELLTQRQSHQAGVLGSPTDFAAVEVYGLQQLFRRPLLQYIPACPLKLD